MASGKRVRLHGKQPHGGRRLRLRGKQRTREAYTCYSYQAGGHVRILKPQPGTLRRIPNQVILKPGDAREYKFYRDIRRGLHSQLSRFTCAFYGSKVVANADVENLAQLVAEREGRATEQAGAAFADLCNTYILLEDLCRGAKEPCTLDLKVGCKQRAAKHDATKRASMADKAARTTSAALGFRLCGMRSYSPITKTIHKETKQDGQNLTADTVLECMARFFGSGPGTRVDGVWAQLARKVVQLLTELEDSVATMGGLRFWGCSLLLVCDASLAEDGRAQEFLESLRLKVIDFANHEVIGGSGADEEFLCGIRNIRAHLQAMLDGCVGKCPDDMLCPPPPPRQYDEEQATARQALFAATSASGTS